jgi:hypothetical protein
MAITNTLRQTIAPNLPVANLEYSNIYLDQYSNVLRLYFNQIDNFTRSVLIPGSGTTAQRPTENLNLGQFYFDTSLGKPIWYNGTVWVNSSGTPV